MIAKINGVMEMEGTDDWCAYPLPLGTEWLFITADREVAKEWVRDTDATPILDPNDRLCKGLPFILLAAPSGDILKALPESVQETQAVEYAATRKQFLEADTG